MHINKQFSTPVRPACIPLCVADRTKRPDLQVRNVANVVPTFVRVICANAASFQQLIVNRKKASDSFSIPKSLHRPSSTAVNLFRENLLSWKSASLRSGIPPGRIPGSSGSYRTGKHDSCLLPKTVPGTPYMRLLRPAAGNGRQGRRTH